MMPEDEIDDAHLSLPDKIAQESRYGRQGEKEGREAENSTVEAGFYCGRCGVAWRGKHLVGQENFRC
jgi:hypothetical protein